MEPTSFVPASNATQRELINKATGEVSPVLSTAFGSQEVTFDIEEAGARKSVVFSNHDNSGELANSEYNVCEVVTVTATSAEPVVETTTDSTGQNLAYMGQDDSSEDKLVPPAEVPVDSQSSAPSA